MTLTVLTHGGAGSYDHKEHDGPQAAAEQGLAVLVEGGSVLDAVVAATMALEEDERFNAGTGSNLRFDGRSIELDAAVMTDDGDFGAVTCMQNVRNPVLIAREVWATPHNLLAGDGATRYARARGYPEHDPATPQARRRYDEVMTALREQGIAPGWCDWDIVALRDHWNFDEDLAALFPPGDTVGAVAHDGEHFAAALSTGGTIATLLGRVGDVPLPGCGLHAGPSGAVCVTGDGDHLARARLSSLVYGWMEAGESAEACVERATTMFPEPVAVGLILIKEDGFAGGSNLAMAWGQATAPGRNPS